MSKSPSGDALLNATPIWLILGITQFWSSILRPPAFKIFSANRWSVIYLQHRDRLRPLPRSFCELQSSFAILIEWDLSRIISMRRDSIWTDSISNLTIVSSRGQALPARLDYINWISLIREHPSRVSLFLAFLHAVLFTFLSFSTPHSSLLLSFYSVLNASRSFIPCFTLILAHFCPRFRSFPLHFLFLLQEWLVPTPTMRLDRFSLECALLLPSVPITLMIHPHYESHDSATTVSSLLIWVNSD